MFLAHLPAGYILTKGLQKKFKYYKFLWVGLLGSIFPDFDLLYFYLIDNRQTLHHDYWTHIPFWIIVAALVTHLFLLLFKKREYHIISLFFFANMFLHCVLDTVLGGIHWLYPFSFQDIYLMKVPRVYDFWVYNFLFHWSMLLEFGIILIAEVILVKSLSCERKSIK